MVLSDTEIKKALEAGHLTIEPVPADEAFNTTAVDLRLANEFLAWTVEKLAAAFGEVPAIRLDTYKFSELAKLYLEPVQTDGDGSVVIGPGQFMLAKTLERVGFDDTLAGRVEGRSSLARLGLAVHQAPTLHAAWRGHITLELHNAGPCSLRLVPGTTICQMLVEPVRGNLTTTMDGTQFQDQLSPHGA